MIQIQATPGGTDFSNAVSRSVSIRLVPPGVILPPNGTPVASFTFSAKHLDASFNALDSKDLDGTIVSYDWTFGDSGTGLGLTAAHTYAAGGTYTVTLTVTDDDTGVGSDSRTINVTNEPPVASPSIQPPTVTPAPITAYGPTMTLPASSAAGSTMAVAWTLAMAVRRPCAWCT